MKSLVPQEAFIFLKELQENNNRLWFTENKLRFDELMVAMKAYFKEVHDAYLAHDAIEKFHVHRIYRDVRFSKNKVPYKTYFGLHLGRKKPHLRGGYYLNIEPGHCFVGGGFWEPNKADLDRIRQEILIDDSEFRALITAPDFTSNFGELVGEELKTAPRGIDKNHPALDLLRKKQYLMMRFFSDEEVLQPNFQEETLKTFQAMRPFFDYMSSVLTTNENGESLYED